MQEKIFSAKNKKRLYFILRIILGIVFIWASWSKILDPQGFARVVQNYQILPQFLLNPVAIILPWVEAICGVLLITGLMVKGSALIVDILLAVFICAFFLNLYRGINVSCGCFSVSVQASKSSNLYIIRDLLLLGTGIWVFYFSIIKEKHHRVSAS